MRQFLTIASIKRVPVRIHWSTLALALGLLAYTVYMGLELHRIVWLQAFLVGIYVSVLAHELGHVIVARRLRVRVHDIILLPIGGAARLDKVVEKPRKEIAIALAGPITNLGIALLLAPIFFLTPQYEWFPWAGNYTVYAFIASLAMFNVLIAVMNLLPIFPLDGGRVACAVLNLRFSRLVAVRTMSYVAWIILAVAIAWSYINAPSYLFYLIPFAVYITVSIEREHFHARISSYLSETKLAQLSKPTCTFEPWDTVKSARDFVEANNFDGVVIADECSPLGFARLEQLQMHPDNMELGNLELPPVTCHDAATSVRKMMSQFSKHPNLIVLELFDYRPVGYLDAELLTDALRTRMTKRKKGKD